MTVTTHPQAPSSPAHTPSADDPATTDRARTAQRTAQLLARLARATAAERSRIRDEVVTLHLDLAAAAAHRYGFTGDHDDAVQVARIGLLEAFDRFDPARQTSFSQFAWTTMHGLLLRHLRDHGWSVRPPRALQESANTLRQTTPALTQQLGRTPDAADLAEELGWTVADVRHAQHAEQGLRATSLNSPTGEPWPVVEHVDWDLITDRISLRQTLALLTAEEQELLRLRYFEELTQAQIGRRWGRNQMHICRRLTRLTEKLHRLLADATDDPMAV